MWPTSGSYERLFLRRHAPAQQPLLPPRLVQLGAAAFARLSPFLGELNVPGCGLRTLRRRHPRRAGPPRFLAPRDPPGPAEDLLRRLERDGKADLDTFRRELNAELACKAAVKKHAAPCPPPRPKPLLRDLMACDVPHTCPHGRPVIKLTRTPGPERRA